MNPDLFKNSPAGRLVEISVEGVNHYAFIPNPLPPQLGIDAKLARLLSDASHALGQLSSLGERIPNPNLLISPFIRREAVLSSRIEGTEAELADLYAYEAGQLALPGLQSKAPESDVKEVLNYVHAMEYGLEQLKKLPVSLRLIRELHARLMQDVRGGEVMPGEFRKSQNWIGPHRSKITESRFVPPPVPDMMEGLDLFEKYIHTEEYPLLIHIALLHYQFEALHPFRDGNGRVGRLLISLMLVERKLLSLPILYLSAFFERNWEAYYDLLLGVSQRGAWYEWVEFFLQGVAEQSRQAIASTNAFLELREEWKRRLTKARASALLIRLAEELFQSPILTIPRAQKILGLKSYLSAQRNIEKLVKAKILKPLNEAKYGRAFFAEDIFQLAQEKSL